MPSLTVLSLHNFYRQPGGEDLVFATESALLERQGHRVIRYQDHNDRISSEALTGLSTIWNHASYRRIQSVISEHHPDVAHFHNTFPLISPAAYYAVRRLGVPVVQKLSNFRLLCPGGIFLREGQPCEQCLERRSLRPALIHKCYRGSRAATAAVTAMLAAHRAVGTWDRRIDVYIALSEFARSKFIQGGLPADRIVVKGNCVTPDPGPGEGKGGYALFVGRLSEEKGISTLADAWRRLPNIPLLVAGDGPLNQTEWPKGVTWLGHQSHDEVIGLMKNAAVLVFPSVCYECAPLTILEAFACGLPVIASNLGSVPELVTDRRNGRLFRGGDADDLASQIRWAFEGPDQLGEMRAAARREFETRYTAEANYKALLEIYGLAIENYARARSARRVRVLKKGTDHSVPARKSLAPCPAIPVDRAVCPLFQHPHSACRVPTPADAAPPTRSTRQIMTNPRAAKSRQVLGVRVDATTYLDATRQILDWAHSAQSRYVCCASVNNIMEAHDSHEFLGVMNSADLVTSDGMPLVWLLRLLGVRSAGRVYGPDLTRHVLRAAEVEDVPVAFFGGSETVLAALLRRVTEDHTSLRIVYAESPPYRAPTVAEDARTIDAIADSGARILFIGLSTPKQDRWMHAHRGRIPAVMLGVGAAFDFLAGAKSQAPRWMQSSGLEWLFRLATEPRRLWRRYLRHNPRFAVLAVAQLLRARHT